MVRTVDGSALRFANAAVLPKYLSSPWEEARRLTSSEELEEAWFLGLRLNQGVAWQELADQFGQDKVTAFAPVVRELCELGLVSEQQGVVRLTRRGVLFSNEVFARFLGQPEPEFQLG